MGVYSVPRLALDVRDPASWLAALAPKNSTAHCARQRRTLHRCALHTSPTLENDLSPLRRATCARRSNSTSTQQVSAAPKLIAPPRSSSDSALSSGPTGCRTASSPTNQAAGRGSQRPLHRRPVPRLPTTATLSSTLTDAQDTLAATHVTGRPPDAVSRSTQPARPMRSLGLPSLLARKTHGRTQTRTVRTVGLALYES